MQNPWDSRYGTEEFIYGKEPNVFFREQLTGLVPGRILLPGDGEGRNGVYAASQGWDVEAFDFSQTGKQKALTLAAERGVKLEYLVQSLEEYSFPVEQFDAVGLFYFHVPPVQRALLHSGVIRSLRSGGTLILEAFHFSQLGRSSGGPPVRELLYDKEIIGRDFSDLDEQAMQELEVELEEGSFHRGPARVLRYVGKKP